MYFNYFSELFQVSGFPHLNVDQQRRLFNICCIDYNIYKIQKLHLATHSILKLVESEKSKLKRLTKELPPEDLFNEMVELSRN